MGGKGHLSAAEPPPACQWRLSWEPPRRPGPQGPGAIDEADKSSRNSERPAEFRKIKEAHLIHSNMDDQSTEKISSTIQKRSNPPRSTISRKKACRKCVKSKLRCDLAKPKCNRCAARGNVCEYPVDQPGRPNISTGECEPRLRVPLQSGGFRDNAFPSTHPSARSQHTADSRTPAQTSVPQRHFNLSSVPGPDLVPMLAADEIRDRWLRPYISASTGQQPKQLNPHTVQYLTCVLKSYLRNFTTSVSPPFVHHSQLTHSPSPVLSYCCANIRTWLGKGAEYEVLILGTIKNEMEKIETQVNGRNPIS